MKNIPTTAAHAIGCASKHYGVAELLELASSGLKIHSIQPSALPDKGWLKSEVADAICTAVVLGYSIQLASMGYEAKFGYEKDGDADSHEQVEGLFGHLGVTIECSKIEPKTTNPIIVAKDSYVSSGKSSTILNHLDGVASAADFTNLRLGQPRYSGVKYYGAYIGGTYDGSTTDLIGVSKLDQYRSQYRDPSTTEKRDIAKKFSAANDVSVAIDTFLSEISPLVLRNKSIRLSNESGGSFTAMTDQDYDASQGLFKSYHGMIRALKLVPNPSASNTTYFEISAGEDTSKVASCFPCQTYMLAADRPASAVHLGRGDNWNIPDYRINARVNPHESTSLKTLMTSDRDTCWAFDITLYYLLGLTKLGSHSLFSKMPFNDIDDVSGKLSKTKSSSGYVRKMTEDTIELLDDIPAIFLESLTFEKSFTNRIIETLS